MRRNVMGLAAAAVFLAGCESTTSPRPIASLAISPATAEFMQNQTVRFEVTVLDSGGVEIEGLEVHWSSGDYEVAIALRDEGDPTKASVYGRAAGTTTVKARIGDSVVTASVTVVRAPVGRVVVQPSAPVIVVGQTIQLSATTRDPNDMPLTGRPVTWTSSNAFATVSSAGLVTGVSPGDAFITARSEGASTTVPVKVLPNTVQYEYYKRNGTLTPAIATLTFTGNLANGSLSIDGQQYTMFVSSDNSTGAYCMLSAIVNGAIGRFTGCGFKRDPLAIWLCESPNGLTQPQRLEYVMFPVGASDRVASTASDLLAAVQSNTGFQGIEVFNSCSSTAVPRWVRNAPGTDYFLLPNAVTVHPAAQVRALLDGALIYSAPGAGTDFAKYAAVRLSPGVFEIWH